MAELLRQHELLPAEPEEWMAADVKAAQIAADGLFALSFHGDQLRPRAAGQPQLADNERLSVPPDGLCFFYACIAAADTQQWRRLTRDENGFIPDRAAALDFSAVATRLRQRVIDRLADQGDHIDVSYLNAGQYSGDSEIRALAAMWGGCIGVHPSAYLDVQAGVQYLGDGPLLFEVDHHMTTNVAGVATFGHYVLRQSYIHGDVTSLDPFTQSPDEDADDAPAAAACSERQLAGYAAAESAPDDLSAADFGGSPDAPSDDIRVHSPVAAPDDSSTQASDGSSDDSPSDEDAKEKTEDKVARRSGGGRPPSTKFAMEFNKDEVDLFIHGISVASFPPEAHEGFAS